MNRRIFGSLSLPSAFGLVLIGLVSGGCSSVDVFVRQGPPSDIDDQRIALAPPVFQADLVPIAEETELVAEASTESVDPTDAAESADDAAEPGEGKTEVAFGGGPGPVDPVFAAGVYVGHLHMAGGYVVVDSERGMQHRSKTIEAHDQARYRKLAGEWLEEALQKTLAWKRIDFVEVEALPAAAVPLPTRREVRGSGPEDLRDNQNLPRFDQKPLALDEARRAALPDLAGAPLLLIPFVTNYYSHNGGWFVGQTYGTAAGARIRVMWVLYDVTDGRVLRWGEIQGRHLAKQVNSPNSTQIDDYLMLVEEAVAEKLRQRLLR